MLLDSAAELMMHRQCEFFLEHAKMYRGLEQSYEQLQRNTGKSYDKELADVRAQAVSQSRERRIERDFNEKCDYMGEHDLLASPQIRVLKKLHKYRNDTYHRDELRPATLSSALKIYTYIVCTMLRDFSPFATTLPVEMPKALERYLEPSERGLGLLGMELHKRIGTRLLNESGVAQPSQLGAVLAQHVEDRLSAMEEDAEECSGFMDLPEHESWDLDAIVCLVQIDPQQLRPIRTPSDARAQRVPIRAKHVAAWREAGRNLESVTDDLSAFASFADVEDAFEPIEALVHQFAVEIDREIQLQIDIARGK